ncbi:MAG: VWA domain-containing protein, partial [Anaerolineales bacterium]|nr:VWA domain-containing protein [Anaerolineales bacterium]
MTKRPASPLPSQILHNLILFGRVLRGLGLDVNPGRMMDVVEALQYVEVWRKSDFYYTLRGFLVKKREDIAKFDEAFELFWQKPDDDGMDASLQDLLQFHNMQRQEKEQIITPPPLTLEEVPLPEEEQAEANDEDVDLEIIELTQTYSTREVLRQKDFGDLTAVEFEQIKRLMTAMIWQLGQRQTRRLRAGKKGRLLDMRRTLRHNFRYGGELLEWKYREQKIKPRPIVILADVSGSMERYTRLLIHFLYGLHWGVKQKVEVFVFSTRLTRITRQLNHKDVDEAVSEVTAVVNDWAGGTRIGDALKTFNFDWSRRVLRQSAVVILI